MKAGDVAVFVSVVLWLLLIVLGPIFGRSLSDDQCWAVTVIWSVLQLVAALVVLSTPRGQA